MTNDCRRGDTESPPETSIFWLLPPVAHIIYRETHNQHTTSHLITVKQPVVRQQLLESLLDYQNKMKNDDLVMLTVLSLVMLLPVQTCDYIPHGVDQALVLLRAANDDAVQLLHVGVDGVQGGRLSTGCRGRQHKTYYYYDDDEAAAAATDEGGGVCAGALTGQGDGGEAGGQGLAQGVQVLLQEAVASSLLHHVAV